jgi:flagellar motor switch protein FliN
MINIDKVEIPLTVSLGKQSLTIDELKNIGKGDVISLDKLAGEPCDLMVNNKIIAKGEVVVVNEKYGIRITRLLDE